MIVCFNMQSFLCYI